MSCDEIERRNPEQRRIKIGNQVLEHSFLCSKWISVESSAGQAGSIANMRESTTHVLWLCGHRVTINSKSYLI